MPKKKEIKVPQEDEDESKIDEIVPIKNKVIEIDEPEPIIGVVEEKIEDDEVLAATEDDDTIGGDDAGLDDEEIDPFGDKWEQ